MSHVQYRNLQAVGISFVMMRVSLVFIIFLKCLLMRGEKRNFVLATFLPAALCLAPCMVCSAARR